MSIFAIGDIHGHSDLMDRLLARLPLLDDDTLVFLGDYVDRGPDSRGVVERLIRLKQQRGDRCVCLLGNHEDMMLDHWRQTRGRYAIPSDLILNLLSVYDYGEGFWLTVGGDATLASYSQGIPEEHVAFLAGLPLLYETADYIFVHAGLHPRGGTPRGQVLWGAPGFWSDLDPLTGQHLRGARRTFAKTVVVGHTPFERPVVLPDVIGIDTDCGSGGPLTAVQLPEMEFYQEPEALF
jgi:serine/threonine protein phosphatase 1